MKLKHVAVAAAAAALMIGSAQAAETGAMRSETGAPSASQLHSQGDWRASKLSGVSVYNDNNEKVGDISDVILDKNGKVAAVVLGVGGFLGVGEHYVAVNFDQLKWSEQPVRTSGSSSSNTSTTTGAASSNSSSAEKNWYPDHAVYNATKEQLKAMPEFKY